MGSRFDRALLVLALGTQVAVGGCTAIDDWERDRALGELREHATERIAKIQLPTTTSATAARPAAATWMWMDRKAFGVSETPGLDFLPSNIVDGKLATPNSIEWEVPLSALLAAPVEPNVPLEGVRERLSQLGRVVTDRAEEHLLFVDRDAPAAAVARVSRLHSLYFGDARLVALATSKGGQEGFDISQSEGRMCKGVFGLFDEEQARAERFKRLILDPAVDAFIEGSLKPLQRAPSAPVDAPGQNSLQDITPNVCAAIWVRVSTTGIRIDPPAPNAGLSVEGPADPHRLQVARDALVALAPQRSVFVWSAPDVTWAQTFVVVDAFSRSPDGERVDVHLMTDAPPG